MNKKQPFCFYLAIICLILGLFLSCVGLGAIFGFFALVLGICSICLREEKEAWALIFMFLGIAIMIISLIRFYDIISPDKKDGLPTSTKSSENIVVEIEESTEGEEDNIIWEDGTSLEYLYYEIDGEYIVLYFDFSNVYSDKATFGYTYSVTAYQNGIELDTGIFYVNEIEKNGSREIKKGVTLRVCEAFKLSDYTSDVEIEIAPWISWDDEPFGEFTIKLVEE